MTAPARGDVHIEVENVVAHYGNLTALRGVSFEVYRGEHLTLLGPSGCGKTTMLRSIAGLETPTAGEIRIDGRPIYSSSQRVNVPTERRQLSMVFQSYAIWPHMTVFDNVAYGLRVRKVPAREIEQRVEQALELVQMVDLARKSAARLSGGQQQRVAVARSIVFNPRVLLFDEPLSNLDAKLRAQMRIELREIQNRLGITSIYVTHDQEEALAMSDRIIVMNVGVIEQVGTPGDIYNRPRSAFVADFVGSANLVSGTVRRDLSSNGSLVIETAGSSLVHGHGKAGGAGEQASFAIRTAYPRLSRERPAGADNAWPVRVSRRVFLGDFIQYLLDWEGRPFVVRRWPDELFEEGETVYLSVASQHCVMIEN